MSSLEDQVEFINNPDPRCPCVLLLDTSGSMSGSRIEQLNQGLRVFQQDIRQDELARRRCEIAIITFGYGGVQTAQNFVTADEFQAPKLVAGGNTPMGEAIDRGLELLRARKDAYRENDISFYRPWVFLITDGEPTDEVWEAAALRAHLEYEKNGLSFFAVGVEGANMEKLRRIAVPEYPPVVLEGLKFVEFFRWLSRSEKNISHSTVGDQVPLPPVENWAAS